jgi:putative Holliday junction resolvase
MRSLGLDVGERRIGVAMSDPTGLIASPVDHILNDEIDQAIRAVAGLVEKYQVERVVVGMPYSLTGQAGPAAVSVQKFIEELHAVIKVPVVTWDERLSTVAAQRSMSASRVKKKRQRDLRDAVAAALILQGYLDYQRNLTA